MENVKIFNNKKYKERRKLLRNAGTPPEKRLWNIIKNKQMNNFKFRRQQSIGYYIVDFYCPKKKLVIEVDGEDHNTGNASEYDYARDNYLRSLGIHILRFKNKQIMNFLDEVQKEIENYCLTTP